MKNLLISLISLCFIGFIDTGDAIAGKTQFSITTTVTKNDQVNVVQSDSVVPGEQVTISDQDLYELSLTTVERDDGKILIKVVLKDNNQIQTPTLLAKFGENVGFEIDSTSVDIVVTKS